MNVVRERGFWTLENVQALMSLRELSWPTRREAAISGNKGGREKF